MTETRSRFVALCQQALACAAVLAVAAPAAGVVDLQFVSPTAPSPSVPLTVKVPAGDEQSPVSAAPVRARVAEVPLVPVKVRTFAGGAQADRTGSGLARLAAADDEHQQGLEDPSEAALSAPTPVGGYATVGVTWDGGRQLGEGEILVEVRSRRDGAWGPWEEVPYEADGGPDPGSLEALRSRGGTNPLVVGDVDDVQVKVLADEAGLPEGLRLSVVDPGPDQVAIEEPEIDTARLPAATAVTAAAATEPTDAAAPAEPTDPAAPAEPTDPAAPEAPDGELTGTPADVTPKPQIFSRAQWGADERMRDKGSLTYAEVQAGFVHHTVNANGYTREQVPAIIRGIYAYHTQSRGWSDVGYNFLVDRFGRIWEGRAGGVDRPVVGAHTLGYNEYTFAVSAIGNFETTQPSDAMLRAYGRLFAWKLSLHGIAAGATRRYVKDRWLPAINGHRDVGTTACPGRYLYARIPAIRSYAVADQRPFTSRTRDTDLAGSRWPDLVVRDGETQRAYVVKTGGQVGFAPGRRAAGGLGGADLVVATPDITGDGRPDVLARDAGTGVTSLRPGDGAGRFGTAVKTYRQFDELAELSAAGDLDGDGHNDLVGRRPDGVLKLFPGRPDAAFASARVIGEGWTSPGLSGAGDFDGDGDADLVSRREGQVLLVPGTGRGSLGAPVALPRTWSGYDTVVGVGDVTNDGRPDLVARVRSSQRTFVYPGDGRGGLGRRYGPFEQAAGLDFLAAAPRASGAGATDLVGRDAGGRLVLLANRGGTSLEGAVDTGVVLRNTDLVLNVGDWNGDGNGDVMTRTTTGDLQLRPGDGRGRLGAPVVAGAGWSTVRMLAPVGDITGDGYPDLMGQPRGGAMRIYPGNGSTSFQRSYVARSALDGVDQAGVGLWDDDGSPDSLIRRSDGGLLLFPGNGPGGLTSGRTLGKAAGYDWLVGAGDVDGDGRPDVLARTARNGVLWLLPGTGTGFGPRRYVADGFGRYDLGG